MKNRVSDKRKLERVDIFLIVEFKPLKRSATYSTGITRNLSCEGFSLESQSFDFGRGEILEFRLKHPQIDLSVTLLGEIVWTKQGWYKYVAGIKFHEVNGDTKSKILELISAVSAMPDEPVPDLKDSEGIPPMEKNEKPEVSDVVGKTDELVPDTPSAESAIVPCGEFEGSGEEVIDETEPAERNEETEIEPAQTSDFQVKEVKDNLSEPDTVQTTLDDIAAAEKDRKKKSRIYIPIVMIVAIIFMLALPVALKKFNKSLESFTDPTFSQDIYKKHPVFATGDAQTNGQTLKEPLEQLQEQPDQEKESVLTGQEVIVNLEQSSGPEKEEILKARPIIKAEKPSGNEVIKKIAKPKKTKPAARAEKTAKTEENSKNKTVIKIKAALKSEKPSKAETVVKSEETQKTEKPPQTEIIAKLEEPLKTEKVEKAEERKKPEKTGTLVKMPKFPKIALILKPKKPQKIEDGSITEKNKVANTVLSEKWKKIGSTKNGIPLFIDTGTISYPSEHIVNFSMKASINEKEFIDLLEIECSQNKLRTIQERHEKNPVLSPYSTEWRDIIPESRFLHEAVCSKKIEVNR